jgi:hypothetical protein
MLDRIVYKYRCWKNKNHQRILGSNEIYLPSPSEFNDPFDCAIVPDYSLLDTVEKQKAFQAKFIASIKSTDPDADSDTLARLLANKFEDPRRALDELKTLWRVFQDRTYGIFSLSRNWDSVLMWSHYSDHHKGFCVGFDMEMLKKLEEFGAGSFICYSNEFPQINPLEYGEEAMFKEIATKALGWAYEEEYRLLSLIRPGTNGRIIRIPDACIKEVVIGARFPIEDIGTVRNLIGRRDIKLFQAVTVDRQFTLRRQSI